MLKKNYYWLVFFFLLTGLLGCNGQSKTDPGEVADVSQELKVTGPLRVLVVADTELAAVLQREWQARSEHLIELTNIDTATMLEQLDGGLIKLDTDVAIFPSPLLGQLANSKMLRLIPRELLEEPEYRKNEIFDLIRRRETQWNRRSYAVSFGSPTPVLLFRTDLVDRPPKTWTDLNVLIKKLDQTLPEGVAPIAQPFADGWASRMLLARAAAYLYDSSRVSSVFDYSNMKPRVASPPFERALDELVASYGGSSLRDLTPATALQEFLEGRAALAITWPSAFQEESTEQLAFPVSVAHMPGTSTHFDATAETWQQLPESEIRHVTLFGGDGRLGAVSRSAKNASLANIFLGWATGEHSGRMSPRSSHTAPFRESHKSTPSAWASTRFTGELATRYVEIVEENLTQPEAMPCPRLPGQHHYVSAMDRAINATLAGEQNSKDALSNLTDSWEAITEKIGEREQSAAYRKSLGVKID